MAHARKRKSGSSRRFETLPVVDGDCGREFEQLGIGRVKVKDCEAVSEKEYEAALLAAWKDAYAKAGAYCRLFGGEHCPLAKPKGPRKVEYVCVTGVLTVSVTLWVECVKSLTKR